jgi:hypothetical protein
VASVFLGSGSSPGRFLRTVTVRLPLAANGRRDGCIQFQAIRAIPTRAHTARKEASFAFFPVGATAIAETVLSNPSAAQRDVATKREIRALAFDTETVYALARKPMKPDGCGHRSFSLRRVSDQCR